MTPIGKKAIMLGLGYALMGSAFGGVFNSDYVPQKRKKGVSHSTLTPQQRKKRNKAKQARKASNKNKRR